MSSNPHRHYIKRTTYKTNHHNTRLHSTSSLQRSTLKLGSQRGDGFPCIRVTPGQFTLKFSANGHTISLLLGSHWCKGQHQGADRSIWGSTTSVTPHLLWLRIAAKARLARWTVWKRWLAFKSYWEVSLGPWGRRRWAGFPRPNSIFGGLVANHDQSIPWVVVYGEYGTYRPADAQIVR